jgi:hypothetical protein
MRQRVDLVSATLEAWQRLDAPHRQRFAEAFLRASLRLDRLQLRAWLLRRLRNHPLVAVDPAAFAISDDMAAMLKTLPPFRANEADRGTGL